MMKIRIPKQYSKQLAKILEFKDSEIESILQALRETPLTVHFDDVSSEIVKRVKNVSLRDVEAILPVLFSLYTLRSTLDSPTPELIDDICLAMEETGEKKLKLAEPQRDVFKDRLSKLLDVRSFSLIVKASGLLREYQHVLFNSRILTDIRPVFESDPERPPQGAIIAHTLKLVYIHNGQTEEFFVTMDDCDIEELIKTLNRAKEKAKNLRSILSVAGLPYAGTGKE